jgi:hypothetical protein
MSQAVRQRPELLSTSAPPHSLEGPHSPAGLGELGALTIGEFCDLYKISRLTYHKVQKLGLGPAEIRIGTVVRISRAAASAWQAARQNPTGEEAEEVARIAAALRERSVRAATKAIASSRHISSKRRGGA